MPGVVGWGSWGVPVSSTVEVKSPVPLLAGVSTVKPIRIGVRDTVTLLPKVTVITPPAMPAQYWPGPGVGQLGESPLPPTVTPVTLRFA